MGMTGPGSIAAEGNQRSVLLNLENKRKVRRYFLED